MHHYALLFSLLVSPPSVHHDSMAAQPLAKDGASLVGCWSLNIDLPFPIPDKDATACFKRSPKGALVGRILVEDEWVAMQQVEVKGRKFRFRVNKDDRNLAFRGEVTESGKSMGGSVKRGDMKRPFTGTKQ